MYIKKKCLYCGNVIPISKCYAITKYCSKKCKRRVDYLNHMEKRKLYVKEYNLNHINENKIWHSAAMRKRKDNGKQNLAMLNAYRKNKSKWYARNTINKLLIRKKITIERKCKQCNGLNNLEIHHEIYPTKKNEILSAIAEGKIYYLCFKCHRAKHKALNNIKYIN